MFGCARTEQTAQSSDSMLMAFLNVLGPAVDEFLQRALYLNAATKLLSLYHNLTVRPRQTDPSVQPQPCSPQIKLGDGSSSVVNLNRCDFLLHVSYRRMDRIQICSEVLRIGPFALVWA